MNNSVLEKVDTVSNTLSSANLTEEIAETTTFVDSSNVVAYREPSPPVDQEDPYFKETIVQFLSRPYQVSTVRWNSSANQTCIGRFQFPDELFKLPVLWRKISNYSFFRAGLRISCRINGTPFHYGQLLVIWRPLALGNTTRVDGAWSSYDNIQTLSMYPHLKLSPSTNEVKELVIPWFNPMNWIPLQHVSETNAKDRSLCQQGTLELWVLTPLRLSTGETPPSVYVTIFAAFENPEIAGYTPYSSTYTYHSLPNISDYLIPNAWVCKQPTISRAKAQGLFANALELGARVSKALGLCNVPDNSQVVRVTQSQGNLSNSTTLTPSLNLSLLPGNIAEGSHPFPDSPSCMSLDNYLSVLAYLYSFEITSKNGYGDVLAAIPVNPLNVRRMNFSNPLAPKYNLVFHNRLSHIASLFRFWNGGMRFHFDFVCSSFHSARVRIAWIPQVGNVSIGDEDYASAVSKVIDLQAETSCDVEVPYLRQNAFLPVGEWDGCANGTLVVTLVNPISFPSPNIPPIICNVWVSALPGFQFSLLRSNFFKQNDNLPHPYIFWHKNSTREALDNGEVEPEARGPNPSVIVEKRPKAQSGGTSGTLGVTTADNQVTVVENGEIVRSLVDIIGKPSYLRDIWNDRRDDFSLCYPSGRDGLTDDYSGFALPSLIDYIRCAFVGWKGSIGLSIPAWPSDYVQLQAYSYDQGFDTIKQAVGGFNIATRLKVSGGEQIALGYPPSYIQRNFIIPFYSSLHFGLNNFFSNTSGKIEAQYPRVHIHGFGGKSEVTAGRFQGVVMSWAASGFSFGYALGPPALAYSPNL